MRKFLPTLVLFILLTACGDKTTLRTQVPVTPVTSTTFNGTCTISTEQKATIESFFKYFKVKDYKKMKQYCSKEFIKDYFHDKDVLRYSTAEFISYETQEYSVHGDEYWILVNYRGKPAKSIYSTDYDFELVENKQSISNSQNYMVLKKNNGRWIITALGNF